MSKKTTQLPASDALTGTELVPVVQNGVNVKTTVQDIADLASGTGGAPALTVNRQTASYTLVLDDNGKLVDINSASPTTLTVPANADVAFPIGASITFTQYGTGTTTVLPASGVTIRNNEGDLSLLNQYSAGTLVKLDTNEWYLFGNMNMPTLQDVTDSGSITTATITVGGLNVGNLSGIETRMVVADSSGVLSTQAIPSGGGTQSLQDVVTVGNYSNTNIFIAATESSDYGFIIQPVGATKVLAGLVGGLAGGTVVLSDGGDDYTVTLRTANLTQDNNITFQNGTGTVAFLSDITSPSTPSLQSVATIGNTFTGQITLNSGGKIITMGGLTGNEAGYSGISFHTGLSFSNYAIAGDEATTYIRGGTNFQFTVGFSSVGVWSTAGLSLVPSTYATAKLMLPAGTATAGTAPLKITTTSAVLLSTPEAGAIELVGDYLYYTTSAGVRKQVVTV